MIIFGSGDRTKYDINHAWQYKEYYRVLIVYFSIPSINIKFNQRNLTIYHYPINRKIETHLVLLQLANKYQIMNAVVIGEEKRQFDFSKIIKKYKKHPRYINQFRNLFNYTIGQV